MGLSERERRLIAAVQDGLPLVPRPYAAVAAAAGMSESKVIERLAWLLANGTIKRLGIVVRHRALGYRANAMIVWDVPDGQVDAIGGRLAAAEGIHLCYRRPRRPPAWPYNLFCMMHGRDRGEVEGRLRALIEEHGLEGFPHEVLFSSRCFKQCGGRYVQTPQQPKTCADVG